jgi:superfamily II DNA or RNA helicase
MILAHRQELVFQARDKVSKVAGLRVDVEMGENRAANENGGDIFGHGRAQAIVSSIQTHTAGGDGGGRMGKFDPNQFGLLIIDEAHHAVSSSYQRVIEYYRSNPKLKVLGVTATPDRADEEALGQVFESVAADYEILDAIKDGWLVPINQQMVNVSDLDFSGVRTTAGDLNGADLAAIMESEKNLQGIAGPTIDIIGDRRTLVFTASVKHAEQICEIFNRHKSGMAAWVCGKTDKDERRRINSDFDNGKIQVLCNCGTHTEGFDSPGVEVIVMGRPTKSRSLYAQMVGRATRPLPGVVDGPATALERREAIARSAKTSSLVIDFVGNSGKHKLITACDILGGKVTDKVVEETIARCRKSGGPVRVDEALEEEEAAEQEREKRRLEAEARRAKLVAKVSYSKQAIDPFDVLQIKPAVSRGWDNGKQLSEKQRNFLRKQGVDPDTIDYPKAKQLIGAMLERFDKNLCSLKQANLLRKFGYPVDVTFEQASATIDALAKNGWRRPEDFRRCGLVPEPKPSPDLANYPPEVAAVDNVPF